MTENLVGPRYDAALRLLDRQIIDRDGRLVAKVDDVELAERDDGRLEVVALLMGPGALGPRLGGRLGRWTVAVWRRLHPAESPQAGRIPFGDVTGIDSAVHVGRRLADLDVDGFERWVDARVVTRMPGAKHEPE